LKKTIFWGTFSLAALAFWHFFAQSIEPFIIAFILAYVLYPMTERLYAKYHLPRSLTATFVLVTVFGFISLILLVLSPVIYKQIAELIIKLPGYQHYIKTELVPILVAKLSEIDPVLAGKFKGIIQDHINNIFSLIVSMFNNIWAYTLATFNVVMIVVLVPILLFFLLKDWPQVTTTLEGLLPIKAKDKINQIIIEIRLLLSAYFKGQLNVCLIQATFYSIGLYFIGLDFALLIGIISGILIIVPILGILSSLIIALTVTYLTFGFSSKLLFTAGLYITGHLLESIIITPNILGDRIGLHPLWIIFAVFITAHLFGFFGVLFAIPIAGITKILLGHAIKYYKSTEIYKK